MSKKDAKLFDVRQVERNIRRNAINEADVQKYLDSLPDVSSKAVTLGEIEDTRAAEAAAAAVPAPREAEAPPAPAPAPSYAMHTAPAPASEPATPEPTTTPAPPKYE